MDGAALESGALLARLLHSDQASRTGATASAKTRFEKELPMYPPEDDEYARCADCDTEVSIFDRVFLLGRQRALCFDCACGRDGIYEHWLDRWTVSPRLDDLAASPCIEGR
jgi:hypothetical protein